MSSDKNMAVVTSMPVTTNHHTTARNSLACLQQGHLGRRVMPDVTVLSPSVVVSGASGGRSASSLRQLASLEDLAAHLEGQSLDCGDSPSAAFSYLDGKFYGEENNSFTFFPKRTRSLPSNYFTSCKAKSAISSKHPLRKAKSVRFADTQGLPLVAVVHQLTMKDSSYTDNIIVPYEDEDILSRCPLILSGPRVTDKCAASDDLSGDNNANKKDEAPRTFALKQDSLSYSTRPAYQRSFTLPSLEPDFLDRVKRDNVVLESVREEPRSLHGIVRVSNIAYEKEVVIRWTHDHWKTSHDTCSVFCSSDGSTDRFAFEVPINGNGVSFAIRFRARGIEYWDNNYGGNYTVLSGP